MSPAPRHCGMIWRGLSLLLLSLLAAPATATGSAAALERHVAEALANNPLMRAEMQSLIASQMRTRAVRAQRMPSLDLDARYTRATGGRSIDFPAGQLFNPIFETLNFLLEQQGEAPMFEPNVQDFSDPILRPREQDTRLRLSAPLYAPEIGAGVDASVARFALQEATLETTARAIVREVHRAYFGAARAGAAERILESSLELLAEDVRIADVLVREGSATRDRVLRARAEQYAAEQRLDAARARSRHAKRQLARLLGRDSTEGLTLPQLSESGLPDDDIPSTPRDEAGRRPELTQLEFALKATEAESRAVQAQRKPVLSVAADYGIQGKDYRLNSDAEIGTVSLLLRWNLFDFGRRRAERDAVDARAARIAAEEEDLTRELQLALDSAEDDAAVAARALVTARARLEAAEAAFGIAERKRAEDALSQVEFLDAERALTEARLGLAIAHFDLQDRYAELDFVRASYPLPALSPSGATDYRHAR